MLDNIFKISIIDIHSKSTIFNGTICHCCENNGQHLKNCIAQFPYIPTPIFILFIAFIFIFQSIKFREKNSGAKVWTWL